MQSKENNEDQQIDKIIEKVQKLLSLANSSNENEAKLASFKAQELIAKYNLDLQQLNQKSEYIDAFAHESPRTTYKTLQICSIITGFFFVKVVRYKQKLPKMAGKSRFSMAIYFIGRKENTVFAKYAFDFLNEAFENCYKAFKSNATYRISSKIRNSYYRGLAHGVVEVLEKARKSAENERGLVLVSDPGLEEATKDIKPCKQKKQDLNYTAAAAGYTDGLKIKIHKPIENKKDDPSEQRKMIEL